MAAITLTALQAQAMSVLIGEIIDACARYEMIKNYNDDQCQVLIEAAKAKKAELDARLAAH